MRLGFITMSQRIKLSRQWVGPVSPRPKKFNTQPSAGKVMATVFWDAKGVIMLNLFDQLRTAICEKCRGKLSKGVLLQQDNERVHTCKIAMDAVERNGYELIPYPAYSPDLAPSNFFLFPNLKKDIRRLHFWSGQPRWLSWMRRPTGDQEVAGSIPTEVSNILSWRLIMKYFLRSFSPFR